MQKSRLDEVISRQESATNLQVAFLDIEKYSQRRTRAQKVIVDHFTECIETALTKMAQKYISYTQTNNYNFSTDVLKIPTGDGAAIAFAFDGLHDVHLHFAASVLEAVSSINEQHNCAIFSEKHWCNCHPVFNLRCGIAEGKTVIYRDINGNFNAAGLAMNMAARVMNFMDGQQIGLTAHAYEQIVDMSDDPTMFERFRVYENVSIKHGQTINIYQLVDPALPHLNCDVPSDLAFKETFSKLTKSMSALAGGAGAPFSLDSLAGQDPHATMKKLLKVVETINEAEVEEERRRSEVIKQINSSFVEDAREIPN